MKREFIGIMGKLTCETAETEDMVEIWVGGEADVYTSDELRKIFQAYLQREKRKILLDLENLKYLDSSTLRVLLDLQKKIEASGGSLKLLKLQGAPLRVFQMSGFLDIFENYQEREQALESFSGRP